MGCLIPTWAETLGDCIQHGVLVSRFCEPCMRRKPTDLMELAREHGPEWWMWDRRTPCGHCGRGLVFMFTRSASTPTTPMISTNRHDVARSERMRS